MPEIRKLPDHLVNLIAAGEVVERPASVVKELLENSLDAEATVVDIELEEGGRKLIAIRDNGLGMNRHNLLLAIQRHATSKISLPSDLNNIGTLGFRGEALPSIASVSRMTIHTSDGEESWKMVISGGKMDTLEPAGRTRGTTIIVENLFFNQPARRKFLKAPATELAWIERIITGTSLTREYCAFTLKHNNRTIFSLPVTDSPSMRLRHRFSLSADTRCIEAKGKSNEIVVKLWVFPDKRWANRKHQFILVNGRLVSSYPISNPLREAFSGPAGEPLILCSVPIDPSMVDVNAHPAKREVRFRKQYQVEAAVRSVIPGIAIHRIESTVSSVADNSNLPGTPKQNYHSEFPINSNNSSTHISYEKIPAYNKPEKVTRAVSQASFDFESPSVHPIHSSEAITGRWDDSLEMLRVSGSYLVTETATGLLIVDQHAAHERILYEEILESITGAMKKGQQKMLIPEEISVDTDEIRILNLYKALIFQAGFDFKIEGDTLHLHGLPVGVKRGTEALKEVVRSLSNGAEAVQSEAERIAGATACSGAIKFGDKITLFEAKHLFHTLFTMKDPFHCPHGRPTMIEFPFSELENRFGR